jgi:hypothetical protein
MGYRVFWNTGNGSEGGRTRGRRRRKGRSELGKLGEIVVGKNRKGIGYRPSSMGSTSLRGRGLLLVFEFVGDRTGMANFVTAFV